MNDTKTDGTSRRDFLMNTTRTVGVSALAGVALPPVHAAENNTIQLALVGCGGRGTGAADERALGIKNGPDQAGGHGRRVPAEAERQLRRACKTQFAEQMDVPPERKFIGFDAYRKAMDCLQARRRRHPRDAARVSLGAVHATPSRRA